MNITRETADYLTKAVRAIDLGKTPIPLTDRCPECEEKITTWAEATANDGHVVYQTTSDTYAVLIGCEGYWVVNPALIGLPSNGWMDWQTPDTDLVCILDVPPAQS